MRKKLPRNLSARLKWIVRVVALGCVFSAGLLACKKAAVPDATTASSCVALTGTSWTPEVTGVASSNHDSAVTITSTTHTGTGPITGLQQGVASRMITLTFSVSEDLGEFGSVTLEAEPTGYPSDLSGSAYPVLVSLNDGTSELVNAAISGTGSDCAVSGFYTCSGSNCSTANSSCTIAAPSAYNSGTVWRSYQIQNYGYVSVNSFPTCNYSQAASTSFPACAFNSSFFNSGKLRTGTYTAKYVLLADSYKTLTGYTAGISLKVIRKKDEVATVGGAVDLNVILVGNANINDSRTDKGKQNLNLLLTALKDIYTDARANIKIGSITAYEWTCANGGDAYASVTDEELGDMFSAGSALVDSASEGKAVNLFVVTSIPFASGDSNLTIAGSSSAILGPSRNSLKSSGIAIASNEELDTLNPNCTLSSCPATSQERDFLDMGRTYSHELGHYLGLFHPAESAGTTQDPVWDTPVCTATQTVSGTAYITINSCLNTDTTLNPTEGGTTLTTKCSDSCTSYSSSSGTYCPTAFECQFNHLMWWTSQNFKNGLGDGAIISPQSAKVLNYNPLVR